MCGIREMFRKSAHSAAFTEDKKNDKWTNSSKNILFMKPASNEWCKREISKLNVRQTCFFSDVRGG